MVQRVPAFNNRSLALGTVVGALFIIGCSEIIHTAVIIRTLPCSMVMALIAVALIQAIYKESMREKAGVEIIYELNPNTHAKAETLGPICAFKFRNHYSPDPELPLFPRARFHHAATKLFK